MTAKVSVIMPVYNAEKWIKDAIHSILYQSYSNWELLLVNDGSTDQTEAICTRYSLGDNRIKVYTQQNQGPSAARNYGLSQMTGQYFIMIDSDDYLDSKALQCCVEMAENNQADMVVFGYRVVNTEKGYVQEYVSDKENVFSTNGVINTQDVESLIVSGLMASNWNKMYSSHIKDLRFNENLSINEDVLFSLKALSASEKVVVIPQVFYDYKIQNANSLSLRFHPEMPKALEAIEEQLISNQNKVLRKGIVHWLMNYLFVHFKSICMFVPKKEAINQIRSIEKGVVFQKYGTVSFADTPKRKLSVVLLRMHWFGIYYQIMKQKTRI